DSARVETPSGYSAFDSAALAGTPKLRFEPALRNGKPIPKWVLLPVDFDIAGTDSAAAGQDSAADGQLP
ncbi:MAG TPA: energy transducer TonB, partial [Longimicrobium sp.]|nr:energy transducer TonB [Longimicrobium sp.]